MSEQILLSAMRRISDLPEFGESTPAWPNHTLITPDGQHLLIFARNAPRFLVYKFQGKELVRMTDPTFPGDTEWEYWEPPGLWVPSKRVRISPGGTYVAVTRQSSDAEDPSLYLFKRNGDAYSLLEGQPGAALISPVRPTSLSVGFSHNEQYLGIGKGDGLGTQPSIYWYKNDGEDGFDYLHASYFDHHVLWEGMMEILFTPNDQFVFLSVEADSYEWNYHEHRHHGIARSTRTGDSFSVPQALDDQVYRPENYHHLGAAMSPNGTYLVDFGRWYIVVYSIDSNGDLTQMTMNPNRELYSVSGRPIAACFPPDSSDIFFLFLEKAPYIYVYRLIENEWVKSELDNNEALLGFTETHSMIHGPSAIQEGKLLAVAGFTTTYNLSSNISRFRLMHTENPLTEPPSGGNTIEEEITHNSIPFEWDDNIDAEEFEVSIKIDLSEE